MLPNFLIIGAPRSGTTSLYAALRQHPEIYFSEFKEPWFFSLIDKETCFAGPGDNNHKRINKYEDYEKLFLDVRNEKVFGEASTLYLHCDKAPIKIKKHIPNVKLIVILRNPVDRAFSNYQQHLQLGRESVKDFRSALEEEDARKVKGWSPFWLYKELGFYNKQLKNYLRYFDKSQLKVFLYEDLVNDQTALYRSVFEYLDVDSSFSPVIAGRINSSGKPNSKLLHYFLSETNVIKTSIAKVMHPKIRHFISSKISVLRDYNLSKDQYIDESLRHNLMLEYKHDILELQELLKRDLSDWLVV
ncbi:MAG: sulfotransferase [Methylococcaceae bacterium]|nr:sulfotransferase [Methylococcaceae bacterium]